jgi:hypothetical protein
MILISYPSGGFGNFLYHTLTEFSSNTYKPDNTNFDFDVAGRSHATAKYTPIYWNDPPEFDPMLPMTDKECLILCDNGIGNDSYDKLLQAMPGSVIVRTCIDEDVRPVIYKTCIYKALTSDTLTETIGHVVDYWQDNKVYSIRENFTLFYYNWPFKWEPDPRCINVSLKQLIIDPVNTIVEIIHAINGSTVEMDRLQELCIQWTNNNQKYFKVYHDWNRINNALDSRQTIDLSDITDLHDQGYINYCLEKKFNYTIPVYDYRNWFSNSSEIPRTL